MNSNVLSIGELARRSGLSTYTLRYYEAAGILKPAGRAANGHRRYRLDDLAWLEFVLRLKATGMPLAEIKRYASLRARGESTLTARLAMLEFHRDRLATRMAELATAARALDDKIGIYRTQLGSAPAKKRR